MELVEIIAQHQLVSSSPTLILEETYNQTLSLSNSELVLVEQNATHILQTQETPLTLIEQIGGEIITIGIQGPQGPAVNIPTGLVTPFAGINAPSGYLFCDGSAVSRTTYSALLSVLTWTTTGTVITGQTVVTVASNTNMYVGQKISSPGLTAVATIIAFIGTTVVSLANASANTTGTITLTLWPYGNGDGLTTFNLPDLRQRVPVGQSPTSYALGASGGEQLHVITISEMPQHRHTIAADYYSGGGSSDVLPVGAVYHDAEDWGDNAYTSYEGASQPMSLMQPYRVFNYIIKT